MQDQTGRLEKFREDWDIAELRGDTGFLERLLTDDFIVEAARLAERKG